MLCATIFSCVEIPTGADEVLSFKVEPLAAPSVIVGDSLRDTLGVAVPLSVTAFNYQGDTVASAPVRFRALDRRIRVDSVSGFVVGDSVSTTASRVSATLDGFNGFFTIPVVLRPDTVIGSNERDSLSYSLTDTAANVSNAIGVKVLHGLSTPDSAVRSFRVTFDLVAPGDAELARFADGGARSSVDTTDASGVADRRIRISPARLTTPVDSVIVQASVKYKGQHVRGSPMRLVLKLKPK
jgi:hypothetical protein